MRNLKKIFAIVLTVALVFSMVSVGVFADEVLSTTVTFRASASDTAAITSVKPGKTIYADVFVPAGEYKSLAVSYATAIGTLAEEDITVGVDGSAVDAFNARDTKAQAKWTSKVTVPENTPVLTIKIVIPEDQAVADNTKVLTGGAFSYNISGVTAGTAVEGSVNVVEGFVGKTAEYVGTTSFPIGTDVAAELVKGTATVKNETGDKTAEAYKTEGWVAPADFDAKKPGTYKFTGKVVADTTKAAEWEGSMDVEANVTLTALTTGTFTVEPTELNVFVEEGKTYKAVDVADMVDKAITSIKAKSGDIEDAFTEANVTCTAAGDLDASTIGNSVNVEVKVNGESDNKLFNVTDAVAATIAVKVVAAEITDPALVAVKTSTDSVTTSDSSLKITVTRAESKKAENGNVKVTAYKQGDSSKSVVVEGQFEADKLSLELELKGTEFEALMDTLSVGDKLQIDVTYDDAAVYASDAKTPIALPVANASSGSKPSGIPSGGSAKAQYNITVAKTENGTVSVAAKAAKGDTVTVTTTADAGYKLDKIVVTTSNGTNVPVTDKTFTMPAYNVTVTATFVEGEEEPTPAPGEDKSEFTDLPSSHWAYEAVKALKDLGIVNGVSADSFAPDNNVTRAEFTKMVSVLFGLKATSTESKFADCGADDWFTPYVLAAAEAGFVNGVDDTHFAPDAQITRQDICTILGRVLAVDEAAAEAGFTDADQIKDYAVNYVKSFVALGVVNGYEDGTFRPEVSATRAEAAKILFGITKLDNEKVKSAIVALKGEVVAPAEDADKAADETAPAEDATEEVTEAADETAAADENAAEETTETAADDTTDVDAPEK